MMDPSNTSESQGSSWLNQFSKVKEEHWSKSSLIECNKYYKIVDCNECRTKLKVLCLKCPEEKIISADISSVHNLRSHIKVRLYTNVCLNGMVN